MVSKELKKYFVFAKVSLVKVTFLNYQNTFFSGMFNFERGFF